MSSIELFLGETVEPGIPTLVAEVGSLHNHSPTKPLAELAVLEFRQTCPQDIPVDSIPAYTTDFFQSSFSCTVDIILPQS